MKVQFKIFLVWLVLVVTDLMAFASNPLLSNKSNELLFKIERSRDLDEIIYELNINEKGQIIASNPIKISWIRYTDHKKIEPLSFIQKQYAYGIKFINQGENSENEWRFQFVSYSKRNFILKQIGHSSYKVYTEIENKEVELKKIYILFENKSFWFPTISAVELYGKLNSTDDWLAETIIPNQ